MLLHKERGRAQPPDLMTAMTKSVYYDCTGLMFICLGFEVAAAHCFVFQEMMSGPKNLLRLDDKRVEQFMTVTCKPGEGVSGVPLAGLAEWNFKLTVYYVKLCELSSRPVVLADIHDNSVRSIEDHQNFVTF